MEELKSLVDAAPLKSFSDYLAISNRLDEIVGTRKKNDVTRIALLSSFTSNGILQCLQIELAKYNIASSLYVAEYDQIAQEILDPSSQLYVFNPQWVYLFWDTQSFLGDLFFAPYSINASERRQWVVDKLQFINRLVERLRSQTGATIVLHNFHVPQHSPKGIMETKEEFGFHEMLHELNRVLRREFSDDNRVHLFDYDSFVGQRGSVNLSSAKMKVIADLQVTFELMPELALCYSNFIKPALGISKKCLVLDLDNTLWGGVIGEEGVEGIQLGPDPRGRAYYEFQKHLLALHDRGVFLAINSRNNYADAMEAFQKHPHQVLKEEHFASIQINWKDKVGNMLAIAKELSIGTDALVFMDDDAIQRDWVKKQCPDIEVIDMPEDASEYSTTLFNINSFHVLQITEEDQKRTQMIKASQASNKLMDSLSLDEYLKSLNTKIDVRPLDKQSVARAAQLTQKTNQFNMTTHRYAESEIEAYMNNPKYRLWTLHVTDKFTDHGLVGLAIIDTYGDEWKITTFLLSCRILRRNIEQAFLNRIENEAEDARVNTLCAEFNETKKNKAFSKFYETCDFSWDNKKLVWRKQVSQPTELNV